MVIRNEEMKNEVRESLRGGPGSVALHHIVPKEALPAKSRLYAINTLQKGDGIGAHPHTNETEIYFVLQGEGVLMDDGERKILRKGDCNVCGGGATHAIVNEKDEPLVFIAVIILE